MQPEVKLTEAAVNLLRCPACKARLELDNDQFKCTDISCCAVFPVVNHIPVLINENGSVFRIDDFRNERDTFFKYSKHGKIGQLLKRLNPTITKNLACKENYQKLRDLLLDMTDKPRVLVVGGSILGKGMESLVAEQAIELVESDVAFGPRAALICDAHDIPFEDDSFDGIIVQAVLEHVVDPQRCADEFYRVLKPGGILYAETAFMQQIHGGAYDFMRFTQLGHRRLFRHFEEIDSGVACGPGVALAWAYQYFLMSFAESRTARRLLKAFARLTSFWWKYFDLYLVRKRGATDGASGFFFMGKKSNLVISDSELVHQYKGLT